MSGRSTDREAESSSLSDPNIGGPGGQPGNVAVNYFADDMVASLSQVVPDDDTSGTLTLTNTYALDAAERVSVITAATNGVALRESTNHYAGGGDSPSWTSVKVRGTAADPWTTTWSRFVAGTDGLGLVEASDGSSKIQITNMHDDVVTQINNTTTFAGLDTYAESTEYGIARDPDVKVAGNYGWLGGHQRSTDTVGGLTLMGARLYNPMTGRFLSMDPVPGGNDNTYTYPPDPVNMTDLSGEWGMPKFVKKAFKKVVHKAKKTITFVRSVAKKVVKAVHRTVKKAVKTVRYVARTYVKVVKRVQKVVKKARKKVAARAVRGAKKVSNTGSVKIKAFTEAGVNGCFFIVCLKASIGFDGDPDFTIGGGLGIGLGGSVYVGGGVGSNEGSARDVWCGLSVFLGAGGSFSSGESGNSYGGSISAGEGGGCMLLGGSVTF